MKFLRRLDIGSICHGVKGHRKFPFVKLDRNKNIQSFFKTDSSLPRDESESSRRQQNASTEVVNRDVSEDKESVNSNEDDAKQQIIIPALIISPPSNDSLAAAKQPEAGVDQGLSDSPPSTSDDLQKDEVHHQNNFTTVTASSGRSSPPALPTESEDESHESLSVESSASNTTSSIHDSHSTDVTSDRSLQQSSLTCDDGWATLGSKDDKVSTMEAMSSPGPRHARHAGMTSLPDRNIPPLATVTELPSPRVLAAPLVATPQPNICQPPATVVAAPNQTQRAPSRADDDTESDEEEEDEPDPDLQGFQEVIDAVNLEALANLATSLRQEQYKVITDRSAFPCEIAGGPVCGTYNLVYFLEFGDGVIWVARIPGWGASPTKLQQQKMQSEYYTMAYLQSETTFKMPATYGWSTSTQDIGVAYGLISYMEGATLSCFWRDKTCTDVQRLTAIRGVATEMAKLYNHDCYFSAGMMRFDNEGEYLCIGSDLQLLCKDGCGWAHMDERGPFKNTSAWLKYITNVLSEDKITPLRRRPTQYVGDIDVLKTMLKTTPRYMKEVPMTFCLEDADFQNIICDPATGEIIGFIDLDNIKIAPVTIGSAAYPPFLTKDLFRTDFIEDVMHRGMLYSDDDFPRYRKAYAEALAAAIDPDLPYDPRWTTASLYTTAFEKAVEFRGDRHDIVVEIARTAYDNIHHQLKQEDSDAIRDDEMYSRNPISRLRFRRKIARGLWHMGSLFDGKGKSTSAAAYKNVRKLFDLQAATFKSLLTNVAISPSYSAADADSDRGSIESGDDPIAGTLAGASEPASQDASSEHDKIIVVKEEKIDPRDDLAVSAVSIAKPSECSSVDGATVITPSCSLPSSKIDIISILAGRGNSLRWKLAQNNKEKSSRLVSSARIGIRTFWKRDWMINVLY